MSEGEARNQVRRDVVETIVGHKLDRWQWQGLYRYLWADSQLDERGEPKPTIGDEPTHRPVVDWDRVAEFNTFTNLDGYRTYKPENVRVVLKDGYSTARPPNAVRYDQGLRDAPDEYPGGDTPQQWSRNYLRRIIREEMEIRMQRWIREQRRGGQ